MLSGGFNFKKVGESLWGNVKDLLVGGEELEVCQESFGHLDCVGVVRGALTKVQERHHKVLQSGNAVADSLDLRADFVEALGDEGG